MRILRLPFLNWFVLNGFAGYLLYMQNDLSCCFSGWMGILAILITLESIAWIAVSLFYFRQYKTSPNPIVQATFLITEGPFRLSRNPLYLAFTSMSLSFALFTHSPNFLISGLLFWLITDLYTIPQEEKFLAKHFETEWLKYSRQTRRWL